MSGRVFPILSAAILFLCFVSGEGSGGTVYVDAGATGDGSGSDWSNACTTIMAGLTLAATGDEVWVKSATYAEAISLKHGVGLYGGFPADASPGFEDRDWRIHETVIDATGLNSSVVSAVSIEDATIDGFTITRGEAERGGGIYSSRSTVHVENCSITGNRATHRGGGIASIWSSLVVTNCTITDNIANGGGGIYSDCFEDWPTVWGVRTVLSRCTIARNYASFWGGGVCVYYSWVNLLNCIIADNVGEYEGGGVLCLDWETTLTNCTVVGNISRGIGLALADESSYGQATVTNCIFCNPGPEILGVNPSVTYSCVQGGFPGEGNIDGDVFFVDTENGDFHLMPGSACIDAGSVAAAPFEDYDRNPRPGGDGLVDMGAFESPDHYVQGPVERVPRVLFVRSDTQPGGNGLSWESAFRTIGTALVVSGASDEIWVVAGTYRESLMLENFVSLYGGFTGTESARDQRDWSANPTIIDATGLGSSAFSGCSAVYGGAGTTLDGFSITGGCAGSGGGVRCWHDSVRLANCVISGNIGTHWGGGVHLSGHSQSLVNCLIVGNSAPTGSGVYCVSNAALVNCTIADNRGTEGGAVHCSISSPVLTNCILWNSATAEISISEATPAVAWSNVRGGWPGDGNIDATPEFVHPWDGLFGDYHLLPDSPCIDSGSNEAAAGILTDLDGNVRIWNGDDVSGAIVDMGAYEFGSTLPMLPGDTDGNGVVNGLDLFFFSLWWQQGENETNFRCDCVDDDVIDEYDLDRLMMDW